jgi:hypothetical protein
MEQVSAAMGYDMALHTTHQEDGWHNLHVPRQETKAVVWVVLDGWK